MPKVSIREIDNTGAETLEYLNYTVLIPGPRLYYTLDGKDFVLEGLFVSANQIEKLDLRTQKERKRTQKDGESSSEGFKSDLGYLMTVELLKRGLSVEFVPAYVLDDLGHFEYSLYDNYEDLYKPFKDKGNYDLRFITTGGISQNITNASKAALICAGDRGDAVAILSVPEDGYNSIQFYNETGTANYITIAEYAKLPDSQKEYYVAKYGFETYIYVDEQKVVHYCKEPIYESGEPEHDYKYVILDLIQYRNLSDENKLECTALDEPQSIKLATSEEIDVWVNDTFGDLCEQHIVRKGTSWESNEDEKYGRYGAIFAPYVTIKFAPGNFKKVPAAFDYLACFATYINKYKSWFAMSGSIRGVSPYSMLNPDIKFGDADINNVFQIRTAEEEGHIATNAICEIRPYGNIIWGNRTMNPLAKPDNADKSAAIQLTASSFLNIRQLCCDIKKTLYRAARRFTFEPNSDALWYNFKGAITPLLDEMKANQGIRGYNIFKTKTNKKGLLVATIRIVPIEAIEDFDLTVELSDNIEVTE